MHELGLQLCFQRHPSCLYRCHPGAIHAVALVDDFLPVSHPSRLDSELERMMREYFFTVRHLPLSFLLWAHVREVFAFERPRVLHGGHFLGPQHDVFGSDESLVDERLRCFGSSMIF